MEETQEGHASGNHFPQLQAFGVVNMAEEMATTDL